MALKVHNGSTFVSAIPKVHNGTSFVDLEYGKVYNGAIWVTCYTGPNGAIISIANINADGTWEYPPNTEAPVGVYYNNDGTISIVDTVGTSVPNWIDATEHAGAFEIRGTLNSGTVNGSSTGTWLPLSSTVGWSKTDTTLGPGGGGGTANLTVEIRYAATGTVRDTATVEMIANLIASGG